MHTEYPHWNWSSEALATQSPDGNKWDDGKTHQVSRPMWKKGGNENYPNAGVAMATIRFTYARLVQNEWKKCTAPIGGNKLAVCVCFLAVMNSMRPSQKLKLIAGKVRTTRDVGRWSMNVAEAMRQPVFYCSSAASRRRQVRMANRAKVHAVPRDLTNRTGAIKRAIERPWIKRIRGGGESSNEPYFGIFHLSLNSIDVLAFLSPHIQPNLCAFFSWQSFRS